MKLCRCPVCHAHINLDQLVADDAGRQLLGLLAKLSYRMGPALVGYLAMFRPPKQDLSNGKALELAQQTLALTTNQAVLAEALYDAVQQLQSNRINGTGEKLKNHRYLQRVLNSKLQQHAAEHTGNTIEVKHEQKTTKEEDRRLFEERIKLYGGNLYRGPENE